MNTAAMTVLGAGTSKHNKSLPDLVLEGTSSAYAALGDL
jgi:hypothetical protein